MKYFQSYLFVPAQKLEVIGKAVASEAHCVIIDLEDAVAISEKENAREVAARALQEFSSKKPIFVRINDIGTPYWEADLACAIESKAFGVVVPKAESAEGIRKVARKIRQEQAEMQIIPLIETAKGVQFCYEIAGSDSLVSRVAFGYIDFALDIGCDLTPSGIELLYTRSQVVIASRAAGIASPIDSVYPHLTHPDGLLQEAKHAKQLGLKGKLTIHPKQLGIIHEVFAYSKEELNEARQVVDAFEEAEKQGVAAITVNGKLVDYPVYQKAKQVLAQEQ